MMEWAAAYNGRWKCSEFAVRNSPDKVRRILISAYSSLPKLCGAWVTYSIRKSSYHIRFGAHLGKLAGDRNRTTIVKYRASIPLGQAGKFSILLDLCTRKSNAFIYRYIQKTCTPDMDMTISKGIGGAEGHMTMRRLSMLRAFETPPAVRWPTAWSHGLN
jgi:hypothetical protein